MIAIGGIIGAGLFVGSSTSIATVGPAVVVSYALAGVLVLLVMRALSELAAADPTAGSFTELIRHNLGGMAGFVTGWLYWYFWVVVLPVEAIAGATILKTWLPFEVWQIGVVLMATMTAVNLTSARSYGEFEFWLSLIKVVAIVGFIVLAGGYALGVGSPTGPTFHNIYSNGGFAPFGVVPILAGVTSVIFALTGAEIATVAAAESADPARTVARIASSVALRILLFYVGAITLIVLVIPWTAVLPGVSPFTTALAAMRIPGAATIMNLVVLVAVLSCLNSGIYVTSRVLFTLAARGDAPQWLVAVNGRGVPTRAILIGSVFGYLALAASILSPQVVFSFLVNASGAIMLFIYLLLCFAQLKRRRELERTEPERLQVRMWFFPWATYAVMVAIGLVLAAMAFTPSLASQLYLSLLVGGLLTAVYAVTKRRRAAGSTPLPERPPSTPRA